jgi:phospholipid/cholesterol/gamma-HCH transport system substrate-binding protein
METRAHHIIIGLFTLATVIAILVFSLWLGKASNDKGTQLFDIVFSESVTGLSVGNDVLYNGIRMGEVVNLRLDKDDPRKVWARIRISDTTPVNSATKARLTIANITGAAIIQLVSGPPDSPPLKRKGDDIPVIAAAPSPFAKLTASSEELLANISQLVNNASQVLSAENAAHLTNILANLDAATGAVASEKEAISSALKELAAASTELRATLAQTSALMTSLGTGFETHSDELLGNAKHALQALDNLSTNLDQLVTGNQAALSQGMQGLGEIGPMLQELRATIAVLGEVSRRLEEDPSGYLLGGEKIQEIAP